ncbi:hypothetical protein M4D55_19140 [Metabacillus idriensis]|nr:GxGYxYP domain-containing protein [Metabacillus idriensis]MCM3597889.1 hypothetical protein [Metabacillus idriensis]
MKKCRRVIMFMALLLLFMIGHPINTLAKAQLPEHLYVIKTSEMSDEEATMIATLQGLLAQKNSKLQLYLDREYGGYQTWLRNLKANFGISYSYSEDPWELVKKSKIKSYILFEKGDDSINAATSLSGVTGAIAIEESLVKKAEFYGLKEQMDVRGKNEKWVKDHFWPHFMKDKIVEQKEDFAFQLRDFAVKEKSMIFYDGNSSLRSELMKGLKKDSAAFGWGDASSGEDQFISPSSKAGVFTIPSDHASNLSVLSTIKTGPLKQKTEDAKPKAKENTHYVTFLMTDGDNVQWLLGDFQSDNRWYSSPDRGTFNMGWGISPLLSELAPSVMNWYYESASRGENSDQFVVGPSGIGYMYPSQYPENELDQHVKKLNQYMDQSDLHIAQIIDFNSLKNTSLWNKYTSQKNIDALFYLEYSRYDTHKGKIVWSNNKPIISAREMLWDGLDGADEQSVIDKINSSQRNPKSEQGYTLVLVHAWSKSLSDVKTVVEQLDSDVEVVTPENFVSLIQENVIR